MTEQQQLFLCSDSIGETADAVARATIRQFNSEQLKIKRYGHISQQNEIVQMLQEAAAAGGFVAYTLVQPELRETMKKEAHRLGVRTVDIMGPMLEAFSETYGHIPKRKPGLLHEMDADYFRRVDAIEFAVKYDDGKDNRGMLQAEVVLIGVSRTSKTPLSIYLAHKGIKSANLPIIPEIQLPHELFKIPSKRIIGLTMDANQILQIRLERLKAAGLPNGSQYATFRRIQEELDYANSIMKQLDCPIINVTNKAIEETAGLILDLIAIR
ncbi:pyruvate, water dikinase regulatory protein [Paenibacillus planticolens]|uniref:Putative pyruvate, phosphate dikinase regulatory protein n=1 Tax=Paenibacillus planticolens TaxID=2654976 RepID=A0ABX1ZPE9_9BACL|nr:pyruvate, water dikinase regulatory protein [Paenibacillus planticolens]NOV01959.1 pyruvate, phosphate dikinase/phosphoenolpyruvate synthase regulator [Paenibacillus planticolens]